MFMMYGHTRFYLPSYSDLLVVTVKQEAVHGLHVATILFYFTKNVLCLKSSRYFIHTLNLVQRIKSPEV